MENPIQTIRELKTKAKNRRDLKRYDTAVTILERAISLIKNELASLTTSEVKEQLASELADCLGLLGGIYRRWGLESQSAEERALHLQQSVDAYEEGYSLEKIKEYHITNSYNMLNRLVSYILLNPDSLSTSTSPANQESTDRPSVAERLQEARETIQTQLREERRRDIWALADLALVKLLLDEEEPVQAYADFIAESPPDYAYDSTLSVLKPMAALEFPVAGKFKQAVELLETKRNELQTASRS